MRSITERLAKRIRRGQQPHDEQILKWATQYGVLRHFHERGLLKDRAGQDRCVEVWNQNDADRRL